MAYKPVAGPQMSSPNVIPMADIMLVLLIIFMVVTPMLQKGKSVDLARTDTARDMQDADKDDAIVVAVVDEIRSAGVDSLGLLTEKTKPAGGKPQQPAKTGD